MQNSRLTIGKVNALLLVCMLLILGSSIALPNLPAAAMLFMRELAFILVPAMLFLALLRLPLRETTRLHWPGGRVVALCLLIGIGMWLFDTWLAVLLVELLGYTTPVPPDLFPTTPPQAILLFLALTIAAPVCEELLFRGIIQRGYERRGPRVGIIAGGILFALFHQSLPQGLALLPIALVLGYVAWRSHSLWSSVLIHCTNNVLAASLLIASTSDPEILPWLGTPVPAAVGLALVATGLWLFRRATREPQPIEPIEPRPGLAAWFVRNWPLLIAAPIYLFVIAMEALVGRFPEVLALGQETQLRAAPWSAPTEWTYVVRNVLREPVGEVTCSLSSQGTAFVLDCRRQQSAYEADTGHGVYYGGDVDERFTARWTRGDLRLEAVEYQAQLDKGRQAFNISPSSKAVQVQISLDDGPLQAHQLPVERPAPVLPSARLERATILEINEWPWRLSALPFSSFYSARASMVKPYTWREETEDQGPLIEQVFVVIHGAEPVKTPAGSFVAWRVEVGDRLVAWYDTQAPHMLVGLDNSVETWVLVASE